MEKEKVVSIEDRIPKLKESRKKKANRRLLFYLSIFFVLIAIIVYLQSPLSHIRHVDIQGNHALTKDEVIAESGLTEGDNIWMLNDTKAKEKIEQHPLIKSVSVKRKLPQTVEVDVDEYKIVGYIEKDETYYPLLEDGELLTSEPMKNIGDEPLFLNFDEQDYLNRLTKEIEDVPDEIFNLISEITWNPTEKNKYKITLYMNDGFVVKTTIRNFASKMKNYPAVISQLDDEKGVIHMEVGTYFEKFTD